MRSRVARRQAHGADASDATVAVLERQRGFAEMPAAGEGVLRIDTHMSRTRLDAELMRLAAALRRPR
jgi:predicted kinase